jgi:hypothetical protein
MPRSLADQKRVDCLLTVIGRVVIAIYSGLPLSDFQFIA